MIFKIMLMTRMLVLMKVYFFLFVSNDANECPKMFLNVDYNAKIVIESDLCANVRFFTLMNVSLRCRSPFHANECIFSRNEEQKVYIDFGKPKNGAPDFIIIIMIIIMMMIMVMIVKIVLFTLVHNKK